MIKNEFYEGILYQIEYQPTISNNDYTQHSVYFIKTKDDSFQHTREAIRSIMNDGSWPKELYDMKNKQQSSIANDLHTYHEFSYDEVRDIYVYIYVIPYDD